LRQSDLREVTVPKSYPPSVRRQISQRLRSGERVAEIAAETGISPATLFRWKDQALVDAGLHAGVPSIESDELAAARKRIARLEAELVLTRDACELFDEGAVVSPKGKSRSSKG
jgi:transposase-like protein